MTRGALFGLMALIPALTPPAAAAAAGGALTILASDCLGGTRVIAIARDPDDPRAPAPRDDTRDCFTGCHAGASRKRAACAC